MLGIADVRARVIELGGSGASKTVTGLLRELVQRLGGTPTKASVRDLLREAVTAAAGDATRVTIWELWRQILGDVTPPAPTLNALTLSSALQSGTPVSGTILGATPGSTIAGNIPGITVNSGARTFSGTPTGGAQTIANGLVETLAGATNTPRQSSVTVGAANSEEAIDAPVLTRASGNTQDPIDYTTSFPPSAQHAGYRLRTQVTTVGTSISDADFSGTLQQDCVYTIHPEDYENGVFPWADFMPPFNPYLGTGKRFIREWFDTDIPKTGGGFVTSPYSNIMDATIAPTYRVAFDPAKTPSGYALSVSNRRATGSGASGDQLAISGVFRSPGGNGKYWLIAKHDTNGEPRFLTGLCNSAQATTGSINSANMLGLYFPVVEGADGYVITNGGGSAYPLNTASGMTLAAGYCALLIDFSDYSIIGYFGSKKGAKAFLPPAVYGNDMYPCMQLGPGDVGTWDTDQLPPISGVQNF